MTNARGAASADTHLHSLTRQRSPLLPRSKPVCRSLTDRIDRVRHQADSASRPTTESLVKAAGAHNLAALILSDCGMAEAARELCWRQFDIFAANGPYDQATAKLALQPLINLGRLHTRDGDGATAYDLHHTMLQATRTRTTVAISGRSIDFGSIVQPGDDYRATVRWLWTILLADGLRALCSAGRWSEALHHAEQHHGIGEGLLDGRQIAIIAHTAARHHGHAIQLIDTTITPTAWERAVAACLRVVCLTWAGADSTAATDAMLDTYLALDAQPEHAVFHIRLGLTVTDLASHIHDTALVTQKMERIALDAADAYAARELLTHERLLPLTKAASGTFEAAVRTASLGTALSPQRLAELTKSVQMSETILARRVARR